MVDPATETALRDLAVRYALAVDQRDGPGFVTIFEDDAELIVRPAPDSGRPEQHLQGSDQLGSVPGLLERYPCTFHMLGQSAYQVDGDGATGVVYCTAHHFSRDERGGRDLVMYIRYRDRYRLGPSGGWRIQRREVLVDWTEKRSTD